MLKQAKRILARAREDHDAIEADYKRPMNAYIKHFDVAPSKDQLVKADMEQLPQEYHDLMSSIAEGVLHIQESRLPGDLDDDISPEQADWDDFSDVEISADLGPISTPSSTSHGNDASSSAVAGRGESS